METPNRQLCSCILSSGVRSRLKIKACELSAYRMDAVEAMGMDVISQRSVWSKRKLLTRSSRWLKIGWTKYQYQKAY